MQTGQIPLDTTVKAIVQTPLPGGVGKFVRFVMNLPTWIQIGGAVVGAVAGAAILIWLVRNRQEIITWFTTRSRGWKIGLVTGALVLAGGGAAFGAASWHYMMHDNDFCAGCHVMGTAWTKFQHSEHKQLQCHNCHQQSMYASMRQLVLWVAEKPTEIPAHAKVPTRVCEGCHNQQHPDSVWKNILATAGHSMHLANANPKLKNVQCVTCHGAEIHHFVPVDKTCGQAGCHADIHIKLGKMAGQTSLHCTGCHAFTAQVAANISPDSARQSLIPTQSQCLDCHAMQSKLGAQVAQLDPAVEPHKAVCGACHDPHKQTTPAAAFASCTNAGCHSRPDTLTPYHRGLPAGTLDKCGTCHKAHAWRVASTECVACHQDMNKVPARTLPSAHRGASSSAAAPAPVPPLVLPPPVEPEPHGPFVPDTNLAAVPPPAPASQAQVPQQEDTTKFSHARHKGMACTACHSTQNEHGALKITQPAGCQTCHHAETQQVACVTCHTTRPSRSLAVTLNMSVWTAPQTRTLGFDHAKHTSLECRTCHTAERTLNVERTCASCHNQHHTAAANCASCHPAVPIAQQTMHPRATTHTSCGASGCHQDPAVQALPPTRNVCLACHRDKETHMPGGDCATCHRVNWNGAAHPGGSN